MSEQKVIGVTNRFLAIEKASGDIMLVPIVKREGALRTDLQNMVRISFGNGSISAAYSGGCEVTDF